MTSKSPGIYAPPGKYRLAFHPTITKGEHYFGVKCHQCELPIHTLENKDRFTSLPIEGKGQFSVPCYHCGHDDLYEIHEMITQVADEDKQSLADQRPSPSNSPKKPYLPQFKDYRFNIGPQSMEIIPDVAHIVARVIACWTLVETALSSFLSICLKANTEPSVALYLSLKNSRARKEALESVVSLTLSEQDQELYFAVMRWKDSVEKSRNDIAHGVLGAGFQAKDMLFWVSTGDYAVYSVSLRKERPNDKAEREFHKRVYVFEIGTLERIAREIEELYNFLRAFGGYLTSDDPEWRNTRYPELCSEPHVAKELAHLRQHQKTSGEDS